MKLHEVRKLAAMARPFSPESQQQMHEFLLSVGIDPSNLYQELEMSSPFVNTHRDISYTSQPVSLHSHTYVEILFCRNPAGVEYLVGPDRYKLQSGDVVLIPPGISHRPILPEHLPEPYVRDVLWINPEFLTSLEEAFPRPVTDEDSQMSLIRTAGTNWAFLGDLFQAGVTEEAQKKRGWEAIVAGNTLKILAYLDRAYDDRTAGNPRAEKPELLDKVTAYIEEHYAEHIAVRDIANKFFISESSISHHFKQKMGISIYHYVTQRRLISAKNLISKGMALEQVATRVGFSDYSAFYRVFRQEYGISPRQYRNLLEHGK